MSDLRPLRCPISGTTAANLVFRYDAPPPGEVGFKRAAGEAYHREIWQFDASRHYVSCHNMSVSTDYTGDYVSATYHDAAGMEAAFRRIIALPPERSDNAHRIRCIQAFAQRRFSAETPPHLLDVGAGLGVFPYAVKKVGWACTALDPDPRAAQHIREIVGVDTICVDFNSDKADIGQFDIVTLNKVLEHVPDPVGMLRRVRTALAPEGFAYIELPDGEAAARAGSTREEFFIEHLHIFSMTSLSMLMDRAGFTPLLLERLQEPSTKYTLRAFCIPTPGMTPRQDEGP